MNEVFVFLLLAEDVHLLLHVQLLLPVLHLPHVFFSQFTQLLLKHNLMISLTHEGLDSVLTALELESNLGISFPDGFVFVVDTRGVHIHLSLPLVLEVAPHLEHLLVGTAQPFLRLFLL